MDLFVTPIMCLALTVYHEARNQSIVGQFAVAQVVMNRAVDNRFPDDVCAVVTQGVHWQSKPARNRCQFSFYCDGKTDTPTDMDAYRWANHIALRTIYGTWPNFAEGATHYHTVYVNPIWRWTLTPVTLIGDHIFYK